MNSSSVPIAVFLVPAAFLGGIIAAFITNFFNNRRAKTERCLQLLTTWTNTSLDQDRSVVWDKLREFFKNIKKEDSSETGLLYGDQVCAKPKLSEILDLARPRPNYVSSFPEDFPDRFIRIMFFLSVLNTFLTEDFVDRKLFSKLFKDSIMPWYQYLDVIDFDDSRVDHEAIFKLKEFLS